MPIDSFTLFALGSLGLAIGFVGGLLGLVLGVLRYPLILSAGGAGVSLAMVAGTNIGISTLGAMTAALTHFRQNNVHLRIFAIMAGTGAVGAFIGSMLTRQVPATLLFIVIGLIISFEAYSLIKSSRKNEYNDEKHSTKPNLGIESSIGFGVGLIGGMVGLVLGSIRMPAMIAVLKMEPKVAVGTNLAASSIMGAAGLTGHLLSGNVDFLVLGVMGSGAMIGGYIGAKYTNRFSAKTLKLLIGIILSFVAVMMFLKAAALI